MAKVIVTGDAVVVKSERTLEEIELIQKYRPEALVLRGGEDGKEEIFRMAVAKVGHGDINKYGASFGGETHDEAKNATITLFAVGMDGDPKEWVADAIGGALMNLNKIEAELEDVLTDIKADRAAIMEQISLQ